SGNSLYTVKKAIKQKPANNQKVNAVPILFNKMGVSCPTMVSAIHMTIMLMAIARPRMVPGNISAATTNFNGPIEKAKEAKKANTHISKAKPPVVPVKKQIPVNNKLRVAPAVPIRYKG